MSDIGVNIRIILRYSKISILMSVLLKPYNQEQQSGDEYGENTAHDWPCQSHNHN